MMTTEYIMKQARRYHACELAQKEYDIDQLAALLYAPQGREFCRNAKFPSLSLWREIARNADVEKYGIYVESAEVCVANGANHCFVGETAAECIYDSLNEVHRIIGMHGAKIRIKASNYAVVSVCATEDCEIKIENDGTAIIMYEYGKANY